MSKLTINSKTLKQMDRANAIARIRNDYIGVQESPVYEGKYAVVFLNGNKKPFLIRAVEDKEYAEWLGERFAMYLYEFTLSAQK